MLKRFICFIGLALYLSGCASYHCKSEVGGALPGTDTALVGIYIDKNGYPQATVKDVRVHPGQKITFVGPDKFDILFKDQRSPIDLFEVSSSKGVLVIEIPRDAFSRQKMAATTVRELVYRYGIRVNGKVTDPTIHIDPE